MTHDELIAEYVRTIDRMEWMVFTKVRLGPFLEGCPEADILMIRKAYGKKREFRIVEAKVSTSDLRTDVQSGKYQKYLPYCDRLVFLCGKEVDTNVLKAIPQYGQVKQVDGGFRTVKAGVFIPHSPEAWNEEVWLALAMGHLTPSPRSQRIQRIITGLNNDRIEIQVRQLGEKLKSRCDALVEREHRCERIESDTYNQIINEMRDKLIGPRLRNWFAVNNTARLLSESITAGVTALLEDNLKKVREFIEQENVQPELTKETNNG